MLLSAARALCKAKKGAGAVGPGSLFCLSAFAQSIVCVLYTASSCHSTGRPAASEAGTSRMR
jgi:hypothetical protein